MMKKVLILPLIGIALAAVSFINPPGNLVGRWQNKLPGGVSAVTVFRTDGTFDVFVNGKTFVSGNYAVRQDTFAISDPVCGPGYYGTYNLAFITEDSIRMTVIQDTCKVRRESVTRYPTQGRVKPAKP